MTRAGVKPAWLLGLLLLAATPTDAWAHGGVPAEIAALDAKLEGDTTDAERAARLTERASLYVRRRDFAAAFADLNEAYDLAPEHAAILYERGRLFAAVDLATAAEWDLSGFLALEPRHVKARLARARVREGAGHIADARADYEAAFAVEPSLDASLGLGGLERKAGDLDAAAAAYERGLDALGDALALRVALVEVETERRHYDRALELLDALIAKAQVTADLRLQRAEVLAAAGRSSEAKKERQDALAELDALLKKRPSMLRRLSRAKALLALDREEEARPELLEVVEEAPDLDEARELLHSLRERR